MKFNNLKERAIQTKERLKEKNPKLKKYIITTVIGSTVLMSLGAYGIYSYTTSNEKYSEESLQKVVLKEVPGEIVKVEKEIEDDLTIVYEFEIKDKDNKLIEVEISSKTGKIIEIEEENQDTVNNINKD